MARGGGGGCCPSMDLMRSEAEGRKMMKWGLSSGTPSDSYYEVLSDCTEDVPKSKFKIKAGKTLSVQKWQAAFSPDGCLDIASVLSRIQRGGVHPTVRGEVWEFLLGCFDPRSTFDEREEIRQTTQRSATAQRRELESSQPGHSGGWPAPVGVQDVVGCRDKPRMKGIDPGGGGGRSRLFWRRAAVLFRLMDMHHPEANFSVLLSN